MELWFGFRVFYFVSLASHAASDFEQHQKDQIIIPKSKLGRRQICRNQTVLAALEKQFAGVPTKSLGSFNH